jgi:DNA repair exonuclease SbcCD nuclease subunit
MASKFNTEEFNQFDLVLLGDIHKMQTLSYKPLTAYAGSLMQLNFG